MAGKMRFKYLVGSVLCNAYRLLRVFPNSDPIMGFVLPAAKGEPAWKAPLFAFVTMFSFDIITMSLGPWTYVTSSTYALIALAFPLLLKKRKTSLKLFLWAGTLGVLAFDFITGPLMGYAVFGQDFLLTTILQVPFTIMHLVSAAFGVLIISPFYDAQIAKEVAGCAAGAKRTMVSYSRFLRG